MGTIDRTLASGVIAARPRAVKQLVYAPVSDLIDAAASRISSRWPGRSFPEVTEAALATRPFIRELPAALPDGRLPAGVHDVDLGSFLLRYATTDRRVDLLRPFAEEVLRLQREGVREVLVGGSTLNLGKVPGDVDALARLADTGRLGIRPRMRAWAYGTHWHIAERRHTTLDPMWEGQRPTWLQFLQVGRDGQPQGVARIVLRPGA